MNFSINFSSVFIGFILSSCIMGNTSLWFLLLIPFLLFDGFGKIETERYEFSWSKEEGFKFNKVDKDE